MLRKLLISSSSSSSVLSNGILRRTFQCLSPHFSSSSSPQTHTDPSSPNKDKTQETILQPSLKISIDRSSLYSLPEHSHEPTSDSELVKHLKGIIKFRGGPISVAEYMEEVLTNPKAVFYINRDVFGSGRDFITSPEVSQMFGEEQMGQPENVNLIELGLGRETLMADLLRVMYAFEDKINQAVFPEIQGGNYPIVQGLSKTSSQKLLAVCPMTCIFMKTLNALGYDLVSGGTENHLVLVNLKNKKKKKS